MVLLVTHACVLDLMLVLLSNTPCRNWFSVSLCIYLSGKQYLMGVLLAAVGHTTSFWMLLAKYVHRVLDSLANALSLVVGLICVHLIST